MAYVVMSACIGAKHEDCVDVCPVECFYDAGELLVIHPEECIDCGACVPECPVDAIAPEEEVPEEESKYIDINKDFFDGKSPEEVEELRKSSS